MPAILDLSRITEALNGIDPGAIVDEIARGFVFYSQGKVVVPPIGELIFDEPRGDTHIKYGYIRGDEFFVIKIASGFYDNPKLGLPAGSGLMLLFSQKTGSLLSVMLDEGYLTQVRTAAAGAVAARAFAPRKIRRVGIFGAGVQGRMQLEYLRYARDFEDAIIWGIDRQELDRYKAEMEPKGFKLATTMDAEEVAATCNLIVTATPSCKPLLSAAAVRKGTHITAMGSDTPDKQELDSDILARADVIVADSLAQCRLRGEIHKALEAGRIREDRCVELGAIIAGKAQGRTSESQITVVDLTGVAVQDVEIATSVYRALLRPTEATRPRGMKI